MEVGAARRVPVAVMEQELERWRRRSRGRRREWVGRGHGQESASRRRRELSDHSKNRAGACSHTGDAQPEHATGGWCAVMRIPTTLVSSVGQVCVPFKI